MYTEKDIRYIANQMDFSPIDIDGLISRLKVHFATPPQGIEWREVREEKDLPGTIKWYDVFYGGKEADREFLAPSKAAHYLQLGYKIKYLLEPTLATDKK